jgi:hypothetical protein
MAEAPFPAWHLPAGSEPAELRSYSGEGPLSIQAPWLTAAQVRDLARRLRDGHRLLAEKPWREVAGAIGAVAERLLDPSDPLHAEAVEALAGTTPLSRPMCRDVLLGMAADWRSDRLVETVEAEQDLAGALDGMVPDMAGGSQRARGFPLTVHIGSGTVPGVSSTAMIRALLVKSAAWVKPGLGDVALTALMARELATADPVLGAVLAVTYWRGEESPEGLFEAADLLVVYGDDRSVESVRRRARARTPVVAYPHRFSLGVVSREALGRESADSVAASVARAASMFDQRGCVSPHLIFVEEGGAVAPSEWTSRVVRAMVDVATELPPGSWSAAEASAVHQLRGEVEVRAGLDDRVSMEGEPGLGWTVVLDPVATPDVVCGARTLVIRPVFDLDEVPALVEPLGSALQTLGFAGPDSRARNLAESLSYLGVTRLCSFDTQAFPPPWWRHDGRPPLGPLVRWTVME